MVSTEREQHRTTPLTADCKRCSMTTLLTLSEKYRPPMVSAQGFSHRVGCFAAHAGEHVGVGVEGDGDGGVAEEFLHELRGCLRSSSQQ